MLDEGFVLLPPSWKVYTVSCLLFSEISHLNQKSMLLFMYGKQNTSGFLSCYQSISKLCQFHQLGGTNKSVRPNKTACLKSLLFLNVY